MRGLFVAFEGIDGAGKFTQIHRVMDWLEGLNYPVGWSSEPNDSSSPMGKHIRSVLKRKIDGPKDPVEFQRMYVLDRGQDTLCFIGPFLAKGGIYLIERHGLSTVAYGMLSGQPAEVFINLHEQVIGPSMIWPDLTVLLDITAEEAIRRKSQMFQGFDRKPNFDLFEKEHSLKWVRENYLALVKHPFFRDKVVVINGARPEEDVFAEIKTILEPRLPSRPKGDDDAPR